jgi:hypothetical protein
VNLLEAESLAGTLKAKMIILVPVASSAPATTKAVYKTDGSAVLFATADAVTSCRLKLAIACATNVDALLTNAQNFI